MSSAFRRAKTSTKKSTASSTGSSPSASSLLLGARGVKPWAGGIHLTSTGISDLDAILGGGQPLGTCIILQEDRWTRDLALSLVKYWCAEAMSQEQRLLVPIFESDDFGEQPEFSVGSMSLFNNSGVEIEELLRALPRNLHWDKQRRREEATKDQTGASLDILEEGEEDDKEEGLENAWQYRKSVQQERLAQPTAPNKQVSSSSSSSATNVFCHSYDLSGRMQDQKPVDIGKHIISLKLQEDTTQTKGHALYKELVSLLKRHEGKIVRLLLFHPDLAALAVALPLLLAYVRQSSVPIVIMVCSSPTPDYKIWTQLSRACDVVLATEGFASRKAYPPPPEFRHLQGLLKVSKVATVTAATANGGGHFADLTVSKRPAAFIYGFKRDRRKLHIPLLHIPPEDYAQGGGSTSGVRSGAGKPSTKNANGMGCASNLSGSVLDF